ncbi:alpha/beta fold hydrolase [Rhodococcus sp. 3Y1]
MVRFPGCRVGGGLHGVFVRQARTRDSGDSRAFSIDAEVEDLRAVVAATGETPLVYGLSSGAALALEAAAQAVPMRKLAVYEAPYMDDDQRDETAQSDLERLIAGGDREGAVTRFLDLTGASAEMVDEIKRSADWPDMCAIAHTLPYDVAVCDHGCQSLDWLASITVPTLVMYGGDSGQWAPASATRIAAKSRGQRLWRSPVRVTALPTTLLSRLCVSSFPANRCAAKTIVNLGLTFSIASTYG